MKLFAALCLALALAVAHADEPAAEPSAELPSIATLVANTPELSTLLAAAQAADLVGALDTESPITVFAPEDTAFAAVLSALAITPAQLLSDPKVVRALLLNHVVPGAATASSLSDGQSLTTLLGGKIAVKIQGSAVTLTSDTGRSATVVTADIPARNGVVHIISGVLTPTTSQAEAGGVPASESALVSAPAEE